MQRFITDPLVPENDKINSIQQGFLCLSTEHKLFDDFQIGVNPDVCVLPSVQSTHSLISSSRTNIESPTLGLVTLMSRLMADNSILPMLKNIFVPPMTYYVITIVNAYLLA